MAQTPDSWNLRPAIDMLLTDIRRTVTEAVAEARPTAPQPRYYADLLRGTHPIDTDLERFNNDVLPVVRQALTLHGILQSRGLPDTHNLRARAESVLNAGRHAVLGSDTEETRRALQALTGKLRESMSATEAILRTEGGKA